jgi:hypothetical protein
MANPTPALWASYSPHPAHFKIPNSYSFMSRIIAIHCNGNLLQIVVVKHRPTGNAVEAVFAAPIAELDDPATIGRRLAELLVPYRQGHLQTCFCPDRNQLIWQALTLPPAPESDLSDLVRFQIAQKMPLSDSKTRWDFLHYSGSEETPHQVLAIGIGPKEIGQIEQIAAAADLKVDHLVPIQAGWITMVRRVVGGDGHDRPDSHESRFHVASEAGVATLWIMTGGKVTLLRTFHLPETKEETALLRKVADEIRRTRMAVAQAEPHSHIRGITLAGHLSSKTLAESLAQALDIPVDLAKIEPLPNALPSVPEPGPHGESPEMGDSPEKAGPRAYARLPLAGIALVLADGHLPMLDLLHPRHTPTAPNRRRTYWLAALAAAVLVLWLGWKGNENLFGPKRAAARAEQELATLQSSTDQNQEVQQQAIVIRKWADGGMNLLDTLERLSLDLRPSRLDAEDFNAKEDLVVIGMTMDRTQLQLDAEAREKATVGKLETRLRQDQLSVQRDNPKQAKQLEQYGWPFRLILEPSSKSSADAAEEQP